MKMKDNYLIFRSAKHPLVHELIKKIISENANAKIYLCIQEECVEKYKEFNDVELIIFPNGFFDYKYLNDNEVLLKQINIRQYNKIFVPYSTVEPKIDEIKKICLKLLKQNIVYLYNKEGKIQKKRIFKISLFNNNRKIELKNVIIKNILMILGKYYIRREYDR